MTPTPLKKRHAAVQGVFAGLLDQKKQRQFNRRRCKRRQVAHSFAPPNVPRNGCQADRPFDAGMFRKPERAPVRGGKCLAHEKGWDA